MCVYLFFKNQLVRRHCPEVLLLCRHSSFLWFTFLTTYFSGKTLDLVRSEVITKVICKKSLKAVVIITDGYSSDDVTLPSIELRDMGVTVVSVGFGEETPYMKYALEAMASDPKDQHRLIFDYGDLMEGVSQVSAVICQGWYLQDVISERDVVPSLYKLGSLILHRS